MKEKGRSGGGGVHYLGGELREDEAEVGQVLRQPGNGDLQELPERVAGALFVEAKDLGE